MPNHASRCLIVSDFNPGNFAGYLANDEELPPLRPVTVGYGQVIRVLTQTDLQPWREEPQFAVAWTLPERILPSFHKLLNHEDVRTNDLLHEVDEYTAVILQAARRLKAIWVPTWAVDPHRRGLGMIDLRPGGIAYALQRANCRLAENLADAANVFVLDAQRWIYCAGNQAWSPALWYQAKVPFGNAVFQHAVAEIKAAVRGLQGQARKLIVVDLDDTLWGGTVGEIGWENLRVGGHDPAGEAFADFQRELKALTRRGVLLGIVSKNEESTALTALQQHPDMQLRLSDFAGWRINWQDKAANIVDLVDELNLGLDAVVFLDDNAVERGRVRDALPDVLVPEWPHTPLQYAGALLSLQCFDAPRISTEDTTRTLAYAAERARSDAKRQAASFDEWLETLNTIVEVALLDAGNLGRAAQLLNKSNQMNLRTRRLGEDELKRWASDVGHHVWVFRVSDRYGDAGLTGLASLELQEGTARIIDFVLSCRVIGRRVEETMIHWLGLEARRRGASQLRAEYVPTAKNKPCRDFWMRSGFASPDHHVFTWETALDYPQPSAVHLSVTVK